MTEKAKRDGLAPFRKFTDDKGRTNYVAQIGSGTAAPGMILKLYVQQQKNGRKNSPPPWRWELTATDATHIQRTICVSSINRRFSSAGAAIKDFGRWQCAMANVLQDNRSLWQRFDAKRYDGLEFKRIFCAA